MARMPGTVWKPLASNWDSQPYMGSPDIVCIHTMVGSLAGTDSYFRSGNGAGFAGTESHFGTGPNGEITQWQDTNRQADANLNGNGHIISIENADYGAGYPWWNINDGSAVPAFTTAQCEAIAKILAWANKTHGIPLVLIPNSVRGNRGIAYHRMGVDPYRVSGGEAWSLAYGKVCPGDRRIAQIPGIIARARELAGLTAPKETFLMTLTDKEQEDLYTRVKQLTDPGVNGKTPVTALRDLHGIWAVGEYRRSDDPDTADTIRPLTFVRRTEFYARTAAQAVPVLAAEVAALRAANAELTKVVADQEGFDPIELGQVVTKAVDDVLAGKAVFDVEQIEVNVNPEGEQSA